MPPTIPTNAVLKDMPDAEVATLAQAYGIEATERADQIKALKAARQAAVQGDDTVKTEETGGENPETIGAKTSGAFEEGQPGGAGVSDGPNGLGTGNPQEGSEAGQGAGPGDQAEEEAEFEFALGAKVFLFERNHDPETSELRDGYQPAKPGTIAKITADTDHIDVRTGGENEPALIHHDVPYRDSADEGANYWSETAE